MRSVTPDANERSLVEFALHLFASTTQCFIRYKNVSLREAIVFRQCKKRPLLFSQPIAGEFQ